MINLNEYDQSKFEPKFKKTDLYKILEKDFDQVRFSKQWHGYSLPTPRDFFGFPKKSIFTAVPFYYLQFLTERNPAKIYDLGCGINIFKKYIPNIIGVGAEEPHDKNFHGDIFDFVDDDYISGHQNFFESVFSINALHFQPLSNLSECVWNFYSMIRPGGTGWLALNAQRMIERDYKKFSHKDRAYLDTYIRKKLSDLEIDYKVFDVDLTVMDEFMDGNIRLVMTKPMQI